MRKPIAPHRGAPCVALAMYLALVAGPARAQQACPAPEPVCASRAAVFAISSPFDPLALIGAHHPDALDEAREFLAR